MGAGVAMKMEMSDYSQIMLQAAQDASPLGAALRGLFERAHLPQGMVDFVMDAIRSLPVVIRASGVQILIFLAGLQGISREVYEAADVEGATGWEQFWLITFPMITPLIVTNLVYTIIDSFTAMNNELILLIRDTMTRGAGYGVSMAMAMLYFAVIAVILVVVYLAASKRTFYHV
jgi:ABC-type polysaccharide transport system permease subunit